MTYVLVALLKVLTSTLSLNLNPFQMHECKMLYTELASKSYIYVTDTYSYEAYEKNLKSPQVSLRALTNFILRTQLADESE